MQKYFSEPKNISTESNKYFSESKKNSVQSNKYFSESKGFFLNPKNIFLNPKIFLMNPKISLMNPRRRKMDLMSWQVIAQQLRGYLCSTDVFILSKNIHNLILLTIFIPVCKQKKTDYGITHSSPQHQQYNPYWYRQSSIR